MCGDPGDNVCCSYLVYLCPAAVICCPHYGVVVQYHLHTVRVTRVTHTVVERGEAVRVFIVRRGTQVE